MATVSFSHPLVNKLPNAQGSPLGALAVHTGMDQIAWSYNLNTANWPTYGGEVVQILSVYIDDMTIAGTCRDYGEMERIYTWFANYMMIATQGNGGASYVQTPVTMTYGPRNWTFSIQPLTMPGFRYAQNVVAPQWGMQAHIVDDTGDYDSLKDMIVTKVLSGEDNQNFALTGTISPNEGNPMNNPFQGPGTTKGNTFSPISTADATTAVTSIGSYFSNLISSYSNEESAVDGTGPAFGSTTAQTTTQAGSTG